MSQIVQILDLKSDDSVLQRKIAFIFNNASKLFRHSCPESLHMAPAHLLKLASVSA